MSSPTSDIDKRLDANLGGFGLCGGQALFSSPPLMGTMEKIPQGVGKIEGDWELKAGVLARLPQQFTLSDP